MIDFWKYSATGNDFVVFDNRESNLADLDWKLLCHRQLGIGADGVLILSLADGVDFKMTYLNSDGGEVEMCGNGGRAITHFASRELGITPKNNECFLFQTMNGLYRSQIEKNLVSIEMTEIEEWNSIEISKLYSQSSDSLYLKVGVPHCIYLVESVDDLSLLEVAPPIRRNKIFKEGTNINFIEKVDTNKIKMRTFERGVESETLSCGTGATAAALACSHFFNWEGPLDIEVLGGELKVVFKRGLGTFSEVKLKGQVTQVFKGKIEEKYFLSHNIT